MEWRSGVFFEESSFCLVATDGRLLVRRRGGVHLQPNCVRPGHTEPTPGVMVWGAISYDSRSTPVVIPNTLPLNLHVRLIIQPIALPFIKSIQVEVFQQENTRSYSTLLTQRFLQCIEMLP
ncbi:transposable element Tc1 transposase [Trichonephila clavipes]|nr:transposable element Tc1 transposase [Trichonephila clavipes]